MFTLNDDLSIYATRGDIVFFSVTAEDEGKAYKFKAGDVVRIKVFGKKDAENVLLQKDFPVFDITESVDIFLTEEDTKIGEVISKPKDLWYEVELNPYDNPQTIIGYDEDGPKVFRLFPEGDDIPEYVPTPEEIPVVDEELDLTSSRPVQNQAIARAFESLIDGYERTRAAVEEIYVTPQMFGAIGDGVSDDTEAFKKVIDFAVDNASGSGWKSVPKIFIPHGTYLVSEPLLNDRKYEAHKFIIEGAGYTNTTIKVAAGCQVLFPNNDIYGFTTFEGIEFIGADNTQTFMEELSGATGNAQSMTFRRCAFRQFHTVLKLGKASGVSYGTMTSETLFFECKISNCGTSDNPCEIFILDNQQSVNNRFYATDIESFVGVLFKYKEGNAITFYQGSIIPLNNAVIVDGTELNGNTSGGGNQPSLTMWGCRFELRGNTKLLNSGPNWGGLTLSFNECGMGCSNLDDGVIPISICGTGSANIYFTRCRNIGKMYCEFVNMNTGTSRSNVLSRVHFEDCSMKVADFVENSTISFSGANNYIAHPEIKIEGVYYNLDNYVKKAPVGKHLQIKEKCLLDGVSRNGYSCGSTSKQVTYSADVYSYIKELTLTNLGNTVYGHYNTNYITCSIYDEDDTLLGTIDKILVSKGSGSLTINKYVKTLKFVFSTDLANSPDLPVLATAEIIG